MLQIPRAQVEDTGRYTCVAVNEAGEDSIQYDVRVLRELDQIVRGTNISLAELVAGCVKKLLIVYHCPEPVPPTIRGTDSDLPDEVTVLVNKTTQLECHVDGNPTPTISWFKDSQPVGSDGRLRVLSNGRTLQVTTRKPDNNLFFQCKVNEK